MIEYTKPKINHYNYDLKKYWYVWFRARDKVSGERRLFIYKRGINHFKDKKTRLKHIIKLKNALIYKLKYEGYSPFTHENIPENIALIEQLNNLLEIKKSTLKLKSYRTYKNIVNIFCKWLTSKRWDSITPDSFSRMNAREYIDYLLKERKLEGKTHNNNLTVIKIFFNAMIERGIIKENPFRYISRLPESSGKNIPYTEIEKEKIIQYLKNHHIRFYYAVCFIYFCFIRRTELIGLRVSDINLKIGTITIQSKVSKNRKQESVTIPVAFEHILKEMELSKYPDYYYVFGHRFETCERRLKKPDNLSETMTKINKKLNISEGKGFYSWKHTGVIELYRATKDPYIVMRQCRHSELKITMIYLRSLGLTVDDNIRRADFKL